MILLLIPEKNDALGYQRAQNRVKRLSEHHDWLQERLVVLAIMLSNLVLWTSLLLLRGWYSFSDTAPGAVVEDRAVPKAPLLDIFQVEAPLRKTYDGTSCKQVVIQHEFAASYGTPYVGMCLVSSGFPCVQLTHGVRNIFAASKLQLYDYDLQSFHNFIWHQLW